MPWQIVERKIGRAGSVKQRTTRQQELGVRWPALAGLHANGPEVN
jgi:hypothetical protein